MKEAVRRKWPHGLRRPNEEENGPDDDRGTGQSVSIQPVSSNDAERVFQEERPTLELLSENFPSEFLSSSAGYFDSGVAFNS